MHHQPAEAFSRGTLVSLPSMRASQGDDPLAALVRLRRPRTLLQAARLGMALYDRRRTLPRLLRSPDLPGPRAALTRLLALEAECETARHEGRADHDLLRHLDLLIAALCEGRSLAEAGDGSAAPEQ